MLPGISQRNEYKHLVINPFLTKLTLHSRPVCLLFQTMNHELRSNYFYYIGFRRNHWNFSFLNIVNYKQYEIPVCAHVCMRIYVMVSVLSPKSKKMQGWGPLYDTITVFSFFGVSSSKWIWSIHWCQNQTYSN